MKRNYYTIHKNKKPKKLLKNNLKYFDTTPFLIAATSAAGAANIMVINSMFDYNFKPYEYTFTLPDGSKKEVLVETIKQHKELKIFNSIENTAEAIKKIHKHVIVQRFKQTGRYGRKFKN